MPKVAFSKVLQILLYIGAVIFVKDTIKEYYQGDTSYTETNEPVSLADIPTLVICLSFEDDYQVPDGPIYITFAEDLSLFPMTYETDVVISATILEDGKERSTLRLLKDQNVSSALDLNLHLSELKLSRKPKWQCYKISSKWSGNSKNNHERFQMQLIFSFPTANESTFSFRQSNYTKPYADEYYTRETGNV